jgi:hypothetical protein
MSYQARLLMLGKVLGSLVHTQLSEGKIRIKAAMET